MPVEYLISRDLDLVYARWWGRVDIDLVRANFMAYLSDRNYRPGRPELLDVSGVTEVDLDFQRVRLILRAVNDQVPGERVHTRTVLWAPDDAAFATGRMYQQLADYAGGISVEVYRDEAEALAALGLPHACIAELTRTGGFLPAAPT